MFAGNFSPAQSLPTALEAMAIVKNTPGTPSCRLLLVGDGMSRAALEQQAQQLELGDSVRFYGSVAPTAVPALAGACDALLVSLSDSPDLGLTIPAKLASCMAAAKPLLVSINGEGAAAAAESGGALVSPACDAAALAENLLALAKLSAEDRAAMGQKAFAYYHSNYRRDLLLQKLEDFLF
jgi:glycosyltransferase involved in cell wall biosynthesis